MQSSYLNNFSYLFVPFALENIDAVADFHKRINAENGWIPSKIENRYLHRYVLEKLSMGGDGCASHFQLDADFAHSCGLQIGDAAYSLDPKSYQGQEGETFPFSIANVELFAFSTPICILAFELRFLDSDPYKIAAAQYYLRKISTEKIHLQEVNGLKESFAEISERILCKAAQGIALDFFFYATPHNEKANFLTYLDVPQQENYDRELFYLKWCYNDSFAYNDINLGEDSENYQASSNTIWGLSVSAAVCLVHRSDDQKKFVEQVFQKNFRKQYLLTYIFLLHQKYMMYLFLTKMSIGLEGNLALLEAYKKRLCAFETHYMFSYISEVPQYQRLYSKIRKLFVLDVLFKDVQEPLLQLTEMQEQAAEKAKQAHDDKINTALAALSLFTIISALTDAGGIAENWGWVISEKVSQYIQVSALSAVFVIILCMIVKLFISKKK